MVDSGLPKLVRDHWTYKKSLPWRPDIDIVESDLPRELHRLAQEYSAQVALGGDISPEHTESVAAALVCAAYWYAFGDRIPGQLRKQKGLREDLVKKGKKDVAAMLAKPPRARPKHYDVHGVINTMAIALDALGYPVGRNESKNSGMVQSRDLAGPFQRLCNGWLDVLGGEAPSGEVYKKVLALLRVGGVISKR